MVLSDEETKLFYQKFEELERKLKTLRDKLARQGALRAIEALGLREVETLVEEMHNIVYDNNEI